MKGFLVKDFYLVFQRRQTLIVFVLAALIMSFSADAYFALSYTAMLTTIVGISTIAYDENDNGFPFLFSLPAGRKTYVKEKYLFCILASLLGTLCGVVILFLSGIVSGKGLPEDLFMMILMTLAAMVMAAGVMIFLQLKYGVERSRIAMFVLYAIVFGILALANQFKDLFLSKLSFLSVLASRIPSNVLGVIAVLSLIAICVLMYFLSVKAMMEKEF